MFIKSTIASLSLSNYSTSFIKVHLTDNQELSVLTSFFLGTFKSTLFAAVRCAAFARLSTIYCHLAVPKSCAISPQQLGGIVNCFPVLWNNSPAPQTCSALACLSVCLSLCLSALLWLALPNLIYVKGALALCVWLRGIDDASDSSTI